MILTDETRRYIESQIGTVAYSAFQTMFNTPEDPEAANKFMQNLLDQKNGNLDCLMAAMLTAVKDKVGGAMSILGRIKIGPIELENVISDIDTKIRSFSRACGGNTGGAGIASAAYSGIFDTSAGW